MANSNNGTLTAIALQGPAQEVTQAMNSISFLQQQSGGLGSGSQASGSMRGRGGNTGNHEQHVDAGQEGGLATAKKRRGGGRPKKATATGSQA